MKIGKWNLEVFDSMNYVVWTELKTRKDRQKEIADPAYFSRPNIVPALNHIKNSMIDEKIAKNEIDNLNSLLESIKSEDELFIERLKNLAQNVAGALSDGK